MIRAVFFDLDGTLADTAPDLASALNRLRTGRNLPPLPFEELRPLASAGSAALIRHGFGIAPEDPRFAELRHEFLQAYAQGLARETRLFPGMEHVLDTLESSSLVWGVITNKPAWLTKPLLEKLGLMRRVRCVVSGDSVAPRKPEPAPLLHACDLASCRPAQSVYIGDARTDVEAGRAAGMHTLAAAYGYLAEGDDPAAWGADAVIDQPLAILDWLAKPSP
jgi:phosphoglycolate phosphatase